MFAAGGGGCGRGRANGGDVAARNLRCRGGARAPAASRFQKRREYIPVVSGKNIHVFDGFENDFRRKSRNVNLACVVDDA
jgi:hypothetical protein